MVIAGWSLIGRNVVIPAKMRTQSKSKASGKLSDQIDVRPSTKIWDPRSHDGWNRESFVQTSMLASSFPNESYFARVDFQFIRSRTQLLNRFVIEDRTTADHACLSFLQFREDDRM